MDHNTLVEQFVFSKVNNARDNVTRDESLRFGLFMSQLDQIACSWQNISNEGARILIQDLVHLNTSDDDERNADDGENTCTTALSESKLPTSNKNGEPSKIIEKQIQLAKQLQLQ